MGRDQVRTQVLLLHSEQSTLDRLSSGFDDRYTVHCATSGTEALNTLGDTPIHVIVSARDLPGMSGVEALREAKKRSPETIGILLAGDNDRDTEALVGEKEVFQVVSGSVKPEELTRLVDNATRQLRLLALAESANDTAANPDEPASQHIVMETSDNGSSIITDGTGAFTALDPKKVAAAAASGASTVDVLVLTKDEEFLATVRESTRGMHTIHYANTLAQAEEALAKGKVGVAVVDAGMVGENVEKLTQHLRRRTQRLVNIVAGRRDDGEMLMDLINRGKVYRFLLKPVSPGRARLAIEASVKYHLEAPESAFAAAGSAGAPARNTPRPDVKPATHSPGSRQKPAAGSGAGTTGGRTAAAVPAGDPPARDDSRFTETMTGIVTNLGKALGKKKKDPAPERSATPKRVEPVVGKTPQTAPTRALPGAMPKTTAPTPAAAGGGASLMTNPKVLGGLAAGVAALALVGWLVLGGSDDAERTTAAAAGSAAATRETARQTRSEATVDTAELLDEARLARQAGQIYNPPGGNAIELYATAAAAAPNDTVIAAELAAVLDEALRMAESAMLERRPADAAAALARVAEADPGNGRLPFLFAQLSQMQLREYLDAGRAALRDARFEDAANAIVAARALDVDDASEIDALAAELAEARSAQRVDDVIARAADRLEAGNLITPPNDNARYYYQLVLSNDPGNVLAQQGLAAIAAKLVLQARTDIDAGNFEQAGTLLDEAAELDVASPELADATSALDAARERQAVAQREAAAREAQERAAAAAAEEQRLANERAEAEQRAALSGGQPGSETGTAARDSDAADEEFSDAGHSEEVETADANDELLGISELTRVKYVAPKYPRAAERRNLSGWVDVVFTVRTDGTVGAVEVRNSEPGDIFVSSALRAVEKWEFEPVVENGTPVERQAGVRMMFALQ